MRLEVLIGMIASGKSTYARKRADEGALVICHDDLTAMLHARYRYEPGLREQYREMMVALAKVALGAGRDVIVDRTHLTQESRRFWAQYVNMVNFINGRAFDPAKVQLVAVVFPVHAPLLHAERRFQSDPRGRPFQEWHNVAIHHFGQAQDEPLDWKAEGFDLCLEAPAFDPSTADDPTIQPVRS